MRCCLSQFTKDARQGYAPVRLFEIENPADPAAVERRITGPRCLCRIVPAGDRYKARHGGMRACKNCVREFVPACARRTGKMIGPPSQKARPMTGGRHRQDSIGDIACFGRAADLIGNDAQLTPFAAKPQHGLHEISPGDAEYPRNAKHQVRRIFGLDDALARRLRSAVNIDRTDWVILAIGCRLRSRIDVIRRQMNYGQSTCRRRAGHDARALGINGEGTLALALRAIYGSVGGAVDDSRQPRRRQGPCDAHRVTNVALLPAQPYRCIASALNERAPNLSAGAEDQKHQATSTRTSLRSAAASRSAPY